MGESTEREWLEGLRPEDEREFYERGGLSAEANELDKALERYRLHQAGVSDLDDLYWAARRYAAGTLLMWCEEHAVSTPNGKSYCWLKVIDRKLGEEETPCRIVPALLVIADARRTEED